jgi:hypothetical protein
VLSRKLLGSTVDTAFDQLQMHSSPLMQPLWRIAQQQQQQQQQQYIVHVSRWRKGVGVATVGFWLAKITHADRTEFFFAVHALRVGLLSSAARAATVMVGSTRLALLRTSQK